MTCRQPSTSIEPRWTMPGDSTSRRSPRWPWPGSPACWPARVAGRTRPGFSARSKPIASGSGLDFREDVWVLTRAFGLPQPWQGQTDFTGQAAMMWTATRERLPDGLPPLPDPDAAAALWTAGRDLPMADAVAHALTVDLATHAHARTVSIMTRLESGSAEVALTPREQEVLALLCRAPDECRDGRPAVPQPAHR